MLRCLKSLCGFTPCTEHGHLLPPQHAAPDRALCVFLIGGIAARRIFQDHQPQRAVGEER